MSGADDLLKRAGFTDAQIAQGRFANTAERMARDTFLAQLIVVSGIEAWQEEHPDVTPEMLAKWATRTLQIAQKKMREAKDGQT